MEQDLLIMLADMEQQAAYERQAPPDSKAQRGHRRAVLYGLINTLAAVHELLEDRLRAIGVAVDKKSRFLWVVRKAAAHGLVTDEETDFLIDWLAMRDVTMYVPTQEDDVEVALSYVSSFVDGVRRIVERTSQ